MAVIRRALALVLIACMPGWADDYALSQVYYQVLGEKVSITTTIFALNKDVNLNTTIYAKGTYDVIEPTDGNDYETADMTSSASNQDRRGAGYVSFKHKFPGSFYVEAGIDHSKEHDYLSTTPSIMVWKEMFHKNTTWTLGYSQNIDEVSGEFLVEPEDRDGHNYYAGLTQVLSPVAIAQVGYSYIQQEGQLSQGNKLVPINGLLVDACREQAANCVPEVLPEERDRQSVTAGLNYYLRKETWGLAGRSTLNFIYRYYSDDWGIKSHTGETHYNKYLGSRWMARLGYRRYSQTEADFYKTKYVTNDLYKSNSPQLKESTTNLYDARLSYSFASQDSTGALGPINNCTVEAGYALYDPSHLGRSYAAMLGMSVKF